METALDRWFVHEVLVHEGALLRYLGRIWPHRNEVHDLRQEIYARVYESAMSGLPHSPKSFLFTTARNLVTDRMRRARVVSIEVVEDVETMVPCVDELSPEHHCSVRQQLRRISEAFEGLPDRCREVVWLRRVENLSQKAIAARLGISEKTVEKQMAKGMRLLAGSLYASGEASVAAPERQEEDLHGYRYTD